MGGHRAAGSSVMNALPVRRGVDASSAHGWDEHCWMMSASNAGMDSMIVLCRGCVWLFLKIIMQKYMPIKNMRLGFQWEWLCCHRRSCERMMNMVVMLVKKVDCEHKSMLESLSNARWTVCIWMLHLWEWASQSFIQELVERLYW